MDEKHYARLTGRKQEVESRIQKEESGVWEAPQCADSDRLHHCTTARKNERTKKRMHESAKRTVHYSTTSTQRNLGFSSR